LAKEKIQVPLSFELGWQRQRPDGRIVPSAAKTSDSQAALR
jgi:hypothetical protein